MRDLLVTILILGSVPVTFMRPYVGILVWTWISLINPHRLSWGFAQTLRVAVVAGVATLVAWLLSKEAKKPPNSPIVWLLAAFTAWISISTIFAEFQDLAIEKWSQVIKILLMTFVAMCLVRGQQRVQVLIWVTAVSLGFYGIRGGIFSVLTGGNFRVYGPDGTFIADNNQLGLALVMTLPLLYYLQLTTVKRWVRLGLWGAFGLTIISVLGTYSRGALLGLSSVMLIIWWRTPRRLLTGNLFAVMLGAALLAAPDRWFQRMETIGSYEEDSSAMQRIYAWTFATKIALERPFVGGGFRIFYDKDLFIRYVPDAHINQNAHSIYFEVLGEAGFIGLFLFLALGAAALTTAQRMVHRARGDPELSWAIHLGRMLQASLIGYAVAGAFLNLGFFDLYYTLLVILVAADEVVKGAQSTTRQVRGSAKSSAPAPEKLPALRPRPA